jgi:integrase
VTGAGARIWLGNARTTSLKAARELAQEARKHIQQGEDPIEVRKAKRDAARVAQAARITFKEAAQQYIDAHEAGWRSRVHRLQWRGSLESYVYPVLGNLPVDAIELPHILKVLEPIWLAKVETAGRVRGRIERVLSWCTIRGYRKGDNPARWSGHLSELLPKKTRVTKPKHFAVMPYTELPAFMVGLRQDESMAARALEFSTLTACRTNEALLARWDEINLKAAVWTVSAERTKAHKEHRVPLSKRLSSFSPTCRGRVHMCFSAPAAAAPCTRTPRGTRPRARA